MNEFTKDELKYLRKIIKLDKNNYDSKYIGVLKKIQFLIDNYCEHKNDKAVSDVDYGMVCADCDATLGFI